MGSYVSEDRMKCKDCPVGYQCPVDGLDAPLICVNGSYQNETKQVQCLDCPANYMCKHFDKTPIPCADGLYSEVGLGSCVECPSGYR